MKTSEHIEQSIRELELQTSAAADERIPADAEAALLSATNHNVLHPTPVLWKQMVKNPWFILGTTAAALFAIVAGIHHWSPQTPSETISSSTNVVAREDTQSEATAIGTPDDFIPQIEPDMVELKLELPKPVLIATPMNFRVDRLEPQHSNPRPPLLVPEGMRNLALGKAVTSSDPKPIAGSLEQITDGKKEAKNGSWVELEPGAQWIQIDLEQTSEVYAIIFWHNYQLDNIYYDVAVQVSNRPDFAEATTLFNNDHDNSLGLGVGKDLYYVETFEGKLIDAHGIEGRYVRLYSRGNYCDEWNHYTEVEVYGVTE